MIRLTTWTRAPPAVKRIPVAHRPRLVPPRPAMTRPAATKVTSPHPTQMTAQTGDTIRTPSVQLSSNRAGTASARVQVPFGAGVRQVTSACSNSHEPEGVGLLGRHAAGRAIPAHLERGSTQFVA